MKAPITPKGPTGLPPFVKKPGIIVWYGRLPGAMQLREAGSRLKLQPRLCRATPVPGTTTPEPKPM